MSRERQAKVNFIKVSHNLKTLNMSTFFGMLTKYGHELKRLEASESNAKRKDKN